VKFPKAQQAFSVSEIYEVQEGN